MCGIAGIFGAPQPGLVSRMLDTLVHRGPDGSGLWEGARVSLGMRRLAIVDLVSGDQPLFNENRSVVLVFNGEIYNHRDLRSELQARGHRFRSHHADGEVVPHLYEEYGLSFVDHLDGMFAFALWDSEAGKLVLARDRLGIKPLYYAELAGGGLAFGSEPKALFQVPGVDRRPDVESLQHYLMFKHVPAPRSAFKGIRQLQAGELMVASSAGVSSQTWWRPESREDTAAINEGEAAATIRGLLEQAVQRQCEADVRSGAYLSGGIDSSSVVAILASISSRPLETFTLVYDEPIAGKDADRAFAIEMAKRYGTLHRECLVRPQDVRNRAEAILNAFDEPFSGVISTYFLTQFMAEHVKVALSGDGADEIFGSYKPHRLAGPLAAVRACGLDAATGALAGLGEGDLGSVEILGALDEVDARMALYLRSDEDALSALHPDLRAEASAGATRSALQRLYDGTGTADPTNRALLVDQMSLLPDQVLAFVDRLSMTHSLEVRPPFLDHTLVEYVNAMPGRLKIRRGRVKHILKEAVAGLLPTDLIDRPKEGFLMPINRWLSGALSELIEDVLCPRSVERTGLLDPAHVQAVLDEHRRGAQNQGDRLWNLVMLEMWGRRFA